MIMKANRSLALMVLSVGLTSCELNQVISPVPEMPYRPRPVELNQPQQEEEPATTWENAPQASSYITPANNRTEVAPTPPTPAAPATPAYPKPTTPAAPVATYTPPAPANTPIRPLDMSSLPAPTPAPTTPTPSAGTDLSKITNDGPIPTALPVKGDPTRVWNPLDTSKTIRIINPKTNQPYPSGKKLKVRGTNYQFYVP